MPSMVSHAGIGPPFFVVCSLFPPPRSRGRVGNWGTSGRLLVFSVLASHSCETPLVPRLNGLVRGYFGAWVVLRIRSEVLVSCRLTFLYLFVYFTDYPPTVHALPKDCQRTVDGLSTACPRVVDGLSTGLSTNNPRTAHELFTVAPRTSHGLSMHTPRTVDGRPTDYPCTPTDCLWAPNGHPTHRPRTVHGHLTDCPRTVHRLSTEA